MRRIALLIASAALLAACGGQDELSPSGAAGAGLAELTVRVDPDGARGAKPARTLELRCAAPSDSAACGAAAGVSQSELAPVPADQACTQRYGGPETATIRGTLRGADVEARYSRTDGCQIARWQHVADLLGAVR